MTLLLYDKVMSNSYPFQGEQDKRYLQTRRSYAAGLRSSKELSSFNGWRHFWQCILNAGEMEEEEGVWLRVEESFACPGCRSENLGR